MKLVDQFEDFLTDTVNLNPNRITTLESRVGTIETFIRESGYLAPIIGFTTQGSWAHQTIIKPPNENKEFDADLVMLVKPVEGWEAQDYIAKLKKEFTSTERYKDMTSSKSRCVVLNYSGDFHLDIVPIVCCLTTDGYFQNSYYVCNKTDNQFELTDGQGFAEWWIGQDAILGENKLIKVAKLLKYLRDIKTTFSAKSVLLTTLIGNQIDQLDGLVNSNHFIDVPTTLKTIITRMDNWLQSNPVLPDVKNPVLTSERFTRHWDQDKYDNFRDKINQYKEWIDDAFNEADREESIKKWQRVFGSAFAKKEEVTTKVSKIIKSLSEKLSPGCDMVNAIKRLGKATVLPHVPENLAHVQQPPYRKGPESKALTIRATEQTSSKGEDLRVLELGDLLTADRGIKFEALLNGKPAHSSLFRVDWQIVNTDDAAIVANQLRGDFYSSDEDNIRYESTAYRGIHWAKAFLINRRTNAIHGSSGRFFVVIE